MTDQDLKALYLVNLGNSEYAALRGVYDAGYAQGAGLTVAQAQNSDPSGTATINTVILEVPTVSAS
jgi:hypothetical protein